MLPEGYMHVHVAALFNYLLLTELFLPQAWPEAQYY